MFHFRLHNSTAHLSNVPSETCYVENIKSTNFILVQTQNQEFTNPRTCNF